MGKKHQEPPQAKDADKEHAKPGGRRVYLFGRLENEVTLPVIRKLLRLNDQDPNAPIDLYINSAGGNGYNADAIIATIHSVKSRVNTICLGHALSGACEILASGTGERSAYEFCTLMFHQTLWEAEGDITNLEIQAAQGQRFRNAQIEMLSRCTGQNKETIRKDIERDHYMSAQDALKYGIIDRVIYHSSKRNATKSGGEKNIVKTMVKTMTKSVAVPVRKASKNSAQALSSARKTRSRRGRNG